MKQFPQNYVIKVQTKILGSILMIIIALNFHKKNCFQFSENITLLPPKTKFPRMSSSREKFSYSLKSTS